MIEIPMIEIDGNEGEGGGQIVRSSLALAAVTGTPVRLINIRGGRKKPGLLRQHFAGVKAIAQICGGDVEGLQLGATEITLDPGQVVGGDYVFEVGSAGSAILVAQTVLPALLFAKQASTVTIRGGTHAAWAPPFEFFERCYLPLLAKMNGGVAVSIQSHGFYPAGGGEITMRVEPTTGLNGLSVLTRDGEVVPQVHALVAKLPASVGQRECDVIQRKTNWPADCFHVSEVSRSGGPGNVVMVQLASNHITELFIGFGKVGVKAEQIARGVLREARAYLASDVPVGTYLADQLLLPTGLAAANGHASEFRTTKLSQHSLTHINVLQRFLDVQIDCVENEDGSVSVQIDPETSTVSAIN